MGATTRVACDVSRVLHWRAPLLPTVGGAEWAQGTASLGWSKNGCPTRANPGAPETRLLSRATGLRRSASGRSFGLGGPDHGSASSRCHAATKAEKWYPRKTLNPYFGSS